MTDYSALEADAIRDGRINRTALITFVIAAMASGTVSFTERTRNGEIGSESWAEIFGDLADDFIDIRSSLIDNFAGEQR